MEDLTNHMRHIPNLGDDNEPIPEPIPSPMPPQPNMNNGYDPVAMIGKSIGLDIKAEDLQRYGQNVNSGAQEPGGFKEFLSAEEAAQLGFNQPGVKLDPTRMADNERNAKAAEQSTAKNQDLAKMLEDVMQEEEQRVIDIDKKLSNPKTRAEIYRTPEQDPNGKADYIPPMAEEGANADFGYAQTKRERVASDMPDPDDLVPSYDYEENETPPEAVERSPEDDRPTTDSSDIEYAEYVKNLTITEYSENDSVVNIAKEKAVIESVSSERNRTKILGDQAFLNSISKFKRDNFRTVDVPLVNSGFMVSMVGTGAVDLTLLYDQTNQSTNAVDYELEKMRITIRNVVDTYPRIDKNNLRNMIHFGDYQLMAYAHLVATLSRVELVHTCSDCGKDFRVTANSQDLLLNLKELRDKQNMINSSSSISQCSLMDKDRRLADNDGFVIYLGHPSYADYIQYLAELQELSKNLSRGQAGRIAQMANILPFIRKIYMPNGVYTNNLYQRFIAMTMLSDGTYQTMLDEIKTMAKMIITPKFGIRKVICPHCGKPNTDITYENLNDLLFFHIMVNRLLNGTEE